MTGAKPPFSLYAFMAQPEIIVPIYLLLLLFVIFVCVMTNTNVVTVAFLNISILYKDIETISRLCEGRTKECHVMLVFRASVRVNYWSSDKKTSNLHCYITVCVVCEQVPEAAHGRV